jgi:hemerythrin-like metal-binding protein/PAS domain S-box-containing protein
MNKEITAPPINKLQTMTSARLYFWLPIIMFTCFMLIIISTIGVGYYEHKKAVIDNSKAFILNDMTNLQREMQSYIQANDWEKAKEILSLRATVNHYQLLAAIDEKGKILQATDTSLINKNIDTLPKFAIDLISHSLINNEFKITQEQLTHNLLASLPLKFNLVSEEISASHVGSLLLIYDLSSKYQQLWQQTIKSNTPVIIIVLTLLVCILFLIRHYVLQPIQTIIAVTENVLKHKKNDYMLCDVKGQGEIAALAHSFNDMMVNRKKHELNLEVSHQQLTMALAELAAQKYAIDQHAIVSITDVKGTITYANDKFCQLSGYSKNELLGQNHRIVRSGFHNEAFYQKLYKTIKQGKVWHGDLCNKNSKGQLYWVETTIVPFTAGNKGSNSFIVIRTDITKQKQAEECLQFVLEGARAVIWDWNAVTNKFSYSERWTKMFGFVESEEGEDLNEWKKRIHPQDKTQCLSDLDDLLAGRKDFYENEHRMLCKDGHYKWVLDRGKVVSWGVDNKPLRVIGTYQDTSESKKITDSLRFSQKMDAIGQLTGGIAHDFNNILGIIMGSLELLQPKLVHDPKSEKLLDSAIKASCRASKLTSQLLDFSRNKGHEIQITNVNSLIHEMDDIFRHLAGNQIKLSYHLYEPLWPVNVESGDFHDAIVNIIINAHDAMPNGGSITIETKNIVLDNAFCLTQSDLSAGEYIEITIGDNGCGIPLNIQQKVFEPFFTTKPPGKGTGLGLAMVFGFAKRFNGSINVYSEVGLGTTFKLYLPKASGSPKTMGKTENKVGTNKNERIAKAQLRASETLLIVDDENDLVEVAKESLSGLGYTIFTANNAQQALAVLLKQPAINVLFSDVVMPGGMNGFELAQQVAQKYPSIKILLTSGFTGKAAMEHKFDETQFPLLAKPYSQANLALTVRELLGAVKVNESEYNLEIDQKATLRWRDEFSLGMKSIDGEHQHLCSFLEKCQQETIHGNKDSLLTHFDELLHHVQVHFIHEEQLMQSSCYTGLKNHHQVHQLLIKQFTKQKNKFFRSEIDGQELIDFFHHWLSEHVVDLDREFVNFYLKFKAKKAAAKKENCS